jgi:hypothetical protein
MFLSQLIEIEEVTITACMMEMLKYLGIFLVKRLYPQSAYQQLNLKLERE